MNRQYFRRLLPEQATFLPQRDVGQGYEANLAASLRVSVRHHVHTLSLPRSGEGDPKREDDCDGEGKMVGRSCAKASLRRWHRVSLEAQEKRRSAGLALGFLNHLLLLRHYEVDYSTSGLGQCVHRYFGGVFCAGGFHHVATVCII